MQKNAQTRKREWQTLFSAPTSLILKLEGLKWPPHLADYEDMLSLQWVTVIQKICPTDGLWVSWPAQLVCIRICFSGVWSNVTGGTTIRMIVGMEETKSTAKIMQNGTAPHSSTAPHGMARAWHGHGTTGHGPARHCTALRCWASAVVRSAERSRVDDAPS